MLPCDSHDNQTCDSFVFHFKISQFGFNGCVISTLSTMCIAILFPYVTYVHEKNSMVSCQKREICCIDWNEIQPK